MSISIGLDKKVKIEDIENHFNNQFSTLDLTKDNNLSFCKERIKNLENDLKELKLALFTSPENIKALKARLNSNLDDQHKLQQQERKQKKSKGFGAVIKSTLHGIFARIYGKRNSVTFFSSQSDHTILAKDTSKSSKSYIYKTVKHSSR